MDGRGIVPPVGGPAARTPPPAPGGHGDAGSNVPRHPRIVPLPPLPPPESSVKKIRPRLRPFPSGQSSNRVAPEETAAPPPTAHMAAALGAEEAAVSSSNAREVLAQQSFVISRSASAPVSTGDSGDFQPQARDRLVHSVAPPKPAGVDFYRDLKPLGQASELLSLAPGACDAPEKSASSNGESEVHHGASTEERNRCLAAPPAICGVSGHRRLVPIDEAGGMGGADVTEGAIPRPRDVNGRKRRSSLSDEVDFALGTAEAPNVKARKEEKRVELQRANSILRALKAKESTPMTIDRAKPLTLTLFFGGFSQTNPFRRGCFYIYKHPIATIFFLIIAMTNSIYIAAAPSVTVNFNTDRNSVRIGESFDSPEAIFDLFCVCVLFIEVVVGIVSVGFIRGNQAWLRCSGVHQVDFAAMLMSIVEYVAVYFNYNGINLRAFRFLRVVRSFCRIPILRGVSTVVESLHEGVGQLFTVLMMLLFFLAALSVWGMAIFERSFRRRCVVVSHAIPPCSSTADTGWADTCSDPPQMMQEVVAITGGYPYFAMCKFFPRNQSTDDMDDYPYDPIRDGYHTCQLDTFRNGGEVNQRCVDIGNPNNGFQHFDHIGGALVGLFQVTAADGAAELLNYGLESEVQAKAITFVLFFTVSCLCTFLLLGLIVAVVTGTFKGVREKHGTGFMTDEQLSDLYKKFGLDHSVHPMVARRLQREKQQTEAEGRVFDPQMLSLQTSKSLKESSEAGDQESKDLTDAELMWKAHIILESRYFKHFMCAVIAVNCGVMGADQFDAAEWKRYISGYIYWGCVVCFITETTLRFARCGTTHYFWKGQLNRLELIITTLTLIGLSIDNTALYTLPSLRLYRLMRYLPTLEDLLLSAVSSFASIMNVIIFIIFLGIAFVIGGRYTFRNDMDSYTRSNFGSFWEGCLTTVQLLLGDQWADVLINSMRAKDSNYGQFFAACYILAWFVFAKLVITNLFVAVVIENFEVAQTINNLQRPGHLQRLRYYARGVMRKVFSNMREHRSPRSTFDAKVTTTAQLLLSQDMRAVNAKSNIFLSDAGGAVSAVEPNNTERGMPGLLLRDATRNAQMMFTSDGDALGVTPEGLSSQQFKKEAQAHNVKVMLDREKSFNVPKRTASDGALYDFSRTTSFDDAPETFFAMCGLTPDPTRTLFLFTPGSRVRRFFSRIEGSKLFDLIVYLSILGSCSFLILTPPAAGWLPEDEEPLDKGIIVFWNLVFTIIFSVEFVVRIVSEGLILKPDAYLRSNWNRVDFIVLLFAWIDETGLLQQGGVAKVIRLMRALRPLRLMKRNKGMRLVIDALIMTLAPVGYVVIFSIFTMVVFALIGMHLFGGKFCRCNLPGAKYPQGKAECMGMHVDGTTGIMMPRAWDNPDYSFDSFGHSMMSLFRVSTVQYVEIMWSAMDITELNKSPFKDNSRENAAFFVIFLVVGSLFVMNLFLGFIVDGFNVAKGTSSAELMYARFIRMLPQYRPRNDKHKPPQNAMSTFLRRVAGSQAFQRFSAACVTLNVIFMITDHAERSSLFDMFMTVQNWFFFGELCGEILLFLVGYGPLCFFSDIWKLFDLFVAGGTAAGYVADNARISQFAKAFRLMRVVRLMRMIKPIRIILETLVTCLPQLANIILLLFLVYSMFAVVGVSTFGTTRFGMRIGPTANFSSWSAAMTTIYQSVAGDNWALIMHDASVQAPACTPVFNRQYLGESYDGPEYEFGDCGSSFAVIYWIAFKLAFEAVMLNLFTGMILENFEFITSEIAQDEDADWSMGASSSQLEELALIFRQYSDNGSSFVQVSKIHSMLCEMQPPIGFWHSYAPTEKKIVRKASIISDGLDAPHRDHNLGHVVYADADRAHERLILAECWLMIRDRRIIDVEKHPGLFDKVATHFGSAYRSDTHGSLLPIKEMPVRASLTKAQVKAQMSWGARVQRHLSETFARWLGSESTNCINVVSFETFFTVALYWRKPEMVPNDLKMQREDRVREVELMAHALTIAKFLRGLVAKRRRAALLPYIKEKMAVRNWQGGDTMCRDREKLLAAERLLLCETRGLTRPPLGVPPSRLQQVELKPYELARNMTVRPHAAAFSDEKGGEAAARGITAFIKRAKTDTVVLRCLDPRLVKLGEFVLADWTHLDWTGWAMVARSDQCFFEPVRQLPVSRLRKRGGLLDRAYQRELEGVRWDGVDLFQQGRFGRRPHGSVLDLQSVVTAEDGNVLRVNVGNFRAQDGASDDEKSSWWLSCLCCLRGKPAQASDSEGLVDDTTHLSEQEAMCSEGTMEVVGYMNALL